MPGDGAHFEGLAEIAIDVCRSAADIVRTSVGDAVELGRKTSPTDVVTQTDIDAEHHIRTRLHHLVPNSKVIGEEQGMSGSAEDAVVWIVDPLDGTVNFTYDLPVVAVSIAAAVDGRVVAGAVVDVVHRETFVATLHAGAFLDGRRLHGSRCASLDNALVTTGFSYATELRRQQASVVAALLPEARDIRCFGSAALQLCWVAAGRADAYFERDTKLWDYSAASLVASEAGMTVEMPCPENNGLCVAAPTGVFESLRRIIEASRTP